MGKKEVWEIKRYEKGRGWEKEKRWEEETRWEEGRRWEKGRGGRKEGDARKDGGGVAYIITRTQKSVRNSVAFGCHAYLNNKRRHVI